jgi:O-antigen/teichoic acid export membrane protein
MYGSRILGVDGIGKVEFSKNFSAYFLLMASLSVNNYGIREGAKRKDSVRDFSKFVHEVLFINIISMLVAVVAFFLVVFRIPQLSPYKRILIVFAITIVMTPMGVEWIYRAQEEYKYIALRTMLFQLLAFGVMLILVRKKEDIIGYAIVLIISSLGSNVMNILHMRKYVEFRFYGNYSLKQHIAPIIMLFVLTISNTLYSYIDTTMIGFILGDIHVGLYSTA